MIITYYGKQFFKIQQGEMVLAFNPVSKNSKTGITAKFGADIALVTTNHPDYNGIEQVSHGERSRLYVARALLQGGDLMVLDESFAALDPHTLRRSMACVLDRASTVVVIAHP